MAELITLDIEQIITEFDPVGRIEEYCRLILQENEKINLVSRETKMSDLRRLAAESLLPFMILRESHPGLRCERMLDIGSGGGFPAFPILLTRTVQTATLVERTQKKANTLIKFSTHFNLPAEIISKTFEELNFEKPFDLITLRLVALTNTLFQKILANLTATGLFIYYHKPEKQPDNFGGRSVTYSYASGSKSPEKFFTIFYPS